MSLDAGFVLAAGKGTRMGALGEDLPKPLWPVFDLSLFQLSLKQLRELGVKRIYANIHHGSELVEDHVVQNDLDVKLLEEKTLLGSGGAFHNLKRKTGESRVLALNCDCLYFFSEDILEDLRSSENTKEHLLLGQKVQKKDAYNEWMTENGWLLEISGPSNEDTYWTFSGISSINLNLLSLTSGESSFFKTVAQPSAKMTRVTEKEFTIHDYGTLEQYERTIWRTFDDESLRERLVSLGAIDEKKLVLPRQSYASHAPRVLNFTNKDIEYSDPGIYIQSKNSVYRVWEGSPTLVSFE